MTSPMLEMTESGIICRPQGAPEFHIDPWRAVERAVITHGHTDHAHWGHQHYLCAASGAPVLRARYGEQLSIQPLEYGQTLRLGDLNLSLHPAGHVLGSAQIRIEAREPRPVVLQSRGKIGETATTTPQGVRAMHARVVVLSGDYKTTPDPTAEPFEPVRCELFVTESTFGLPIYRWPEPARVFDEINHWWRTNQTLGKTSIIYAYALGKAQRLLAGVDASIGPILVHGAVAKLIPPYEAAGIRLAKPAPANADEAKRMKGRALVIAPPASANSAWVRRFAPFSDGVASGWALVRGTRRRFSVDRGFVLSDHADWPGLLSAIDSTRAETVGVTHGQTRVLARWLNERGLAAFPIETRFRGEADDAPEPDHAGEHPPKHTTALAPEYPADAPAPLPD